MLHNETRAPATGSGPAVVRPAVGTKRTDGLARRELLSAASAPTVASALGSGAWGATAADAGFDIETAFADFTTGCTGAAGDGNAARRGDRTDSRGRVTVAIVLHHTHGQRLPPPAPSAAAS